MFVHFLFVCLFVANECQMKCVCKMCLCVSVCLGVWLVLNNRWNCVWERRSFSHIFCSQKIKIDVCVFFREKNLSCWHWFTVPSFTLLPAIPINNFSFFFSFVISICVLVAASYLIQFISIHSLFKLSTYTYHYNYPKIELFQKQNGREGVTKTYILNFSSITTISCMPHTYIFIEL